MRKDLKHWPQALALAEQLDPGSIPAIGAEHAAMLETIGEYQQARAHYQQVRAGTVAAWRQHASRWISNIDLSQSLRCPVVSLCNAIPAQLLLYILCVKLGSALSLTARCAGAHLSPSTMPTCCKGASIHL